MCPCQSAPLSLGQAPACCPPRLPGPQDRRLAAIEVRRWSSGSPRCTSASAPPRAPAPYAVQEAPERGATASMDAPTESRKPTISLPAAVAACSARQAKWSRRTGRDPGSGLASAATSPVGTRPLFRLGVRTHVCFHLSPLQPPPLMMYYSPGGDGWRQPGQPGLLLAVPCQVPDKSACGQSCNCVD